MIDDILPVLEGEITGEPLVSLWRHYPDADLDSKKLTKATLSDYKRHPSDLIKLSPHGSYCSADFGCKIIPGSSEKGESGSTHCSNVVIKNPENWGQIEYTDPNDGHLGMQLDYIRRMKKALPETPMMMTVFSPTMVARKLSGNQLPTHLRELDDKASITDAIGVISRVMSEFSAASIDSGADGLFLAVREFDRTNVPTDQMNDLVNLNADFMKTSRTKAEFTVLHLHGKDVDFERGVHTFKPTAVNWHDRTSGPSISEAARIFGGGLFGGLEPKEVLDGKYEDSVSMARRLRKEVPLILSPGCVLLQGTPDQTISAIYSSYKQ